MRADELAELDEHASRAFGMQEGDEIPVRTLAWLVVDEPNAARPQGSEFGTEIVHAIGRVVHLRICVAAKARYRRVFTQRRKKFDDGIACRNTDNLNALLRDGFPVRDGKTKRGRIKRHHRVEIFHDDRYVVDRALGVRYCEAPWYCLAAGGSARMFLGGLL